MRGCKAENYQVPAAGRRDLQLPPAEDTGQQSQPWHGEETFPKSLRALRGRAEAPTPTGQQGRVGSGSCQGCPHSPPPSGFLSLPHPHSSFIFRHSVNHLQSSLAPSWSIHTHLPTLTHSSYTRSHVYTFQGSQVRLCLNGLQ